MKYEYIGGLLFWDSKLICWLAQISQYRYEGSWLARKEEIIFSKEEPYGYFNMKYSHLSELLLHYLI